MRVYMVRNEISQTMEEDFFYYKHFGWIKSVFPDHIEWSKPMSHFDDFRDFLNHIPSVYNPDDYKKEICKDPADLNYIQQTYEKEMKDYI